jgi:hypothetical protein
MGDDLARLRRKLAAQSQSEAQRTRLLERGEVMPLSLPAWALDAARGECTTVVFLAPVPTQFLLHVHPWPGLPNAFASSAGALELTRCGRARASLLQAFVEMRSPRAVLHTLVAVGAQAPAPLIDSLPERDAGSAAPAGDPGPPLPRAPLGERLRRFEVLAREAGAVAVETRLLPSQGYVRLALEPGCHRLLATTKTSSEPYQLLLQSPEASEPERYDASDEGDVAHELCTVRPRPLLVSVEGQPGEVERQLAIGHFSLPRGLPGRFGPAAAERLLEALGGSTAPKALGTLVASSLGAQGRTPLPRGLLPHTCYLGVAAAIHGRPAAVSLAVEAGTLNAQSSSSEGQPGPRVAFCTGRDAQVALDVEARGLGVAWLFGLFQVGPARVEAP